MSGPTDNPDEIDLDLPALDGEEDAPAADFAQDALDISDDDDADAFDDATSDNDTFGLEIVVEGSEAGWLVDADEATTLDVGLFDIALAPEGKILEDDEPDASGAVFDLVSLDEVVVADNGEEGPLADDEELREEDLPALDADEDGDVPDEDLYDRAMLVSEEDLRWDDRAWARVTEFAASGDEPEDSGVLAVPGDDPVHSARDGAWKMLDESGRIMAAGFVSGGSVVVALAKGDRSTAVLVRIQPDGEARIIAEVDPRLAGGKVAAEDTGEVCIVTFIRWDAARGCLFVGGNFGVEAYRPA